MQRKQSRKIITLLWVIFIIPLLMAIALYFSRSHWHFKTTNYGNFLDPMPQIEQLIEKENIEKIKDRWLLIYYSPSCETDCLEELKKLDSIYFSLGKEISKVKEILFFAKGNKISSENNSPFLLQFQLSKNENFLQNDNAFFIADPMGNIILTYPKDAKANGILRDLRHLLKVANG